MKYNDNNLIMLLLVTLYSIDFSLITFNWFHTIFIDNLPIEVRVHVYEQLLDQYVFVAIAYIQWTST